ncbi:hypothetical protein ISN44_As02g001540 [Arabidopsis suecica]|uniref:Uncharacterized protein n=1 Tax=Arabidopsis suecica TaxID=45249 RepID=A0A8T2G0T0_ARASU|nr:hypothetical protein ISN44_As02g001540 [Arabidopsis suecica]
MKMILKLPAITMVATLLLLASVLGHARIEPFSPTLKPKFQIDSKPFNPPVIPTEPFPPPPPNHDAMISVQQFPVIPYCPPGYQNPGWPPSS